MALLFAPIVLVLWAANGKQQERSSALMGSLELLLTDAVDTAEGEAKRREAQVRKQDFETRLANALEMSDGESEVIETVERAFAVTLPSSAVELLLADNSHAHLSRMAMYVPRENSSGCSVDSPDHCPAARRAQVQYFADSEDLDACPKLRGRSEGALSAVCVPVSIMGRTVGVIHATGEPNVTFAEDRVQNLGTLANLAGARIGLLRMVAETQLQATTDSLTGLMNRRAFENRVHALRGAGTSFSVAMADLDHFKQLNDTYGHETGDRALRLFAQTVTTSLRREDLICRHGGEEFAIAFPSCSATSAHSALEKLRAKLVVAIQSAGLPEHTASFGVVEAQRDEDLSAMLARADEALFEAKREGRDRIVVHDVSGETLPIETSPQLRPDGDGEQATDRAPRRRAFHTVPDAAEPNVV